MARSVETQPLVEREAELRLADAVLERALGGEGAAMLVEGDPGIGKTRLLEVIGGRAEERGMRVLQARASPLEGAFAFGVLRSLLAPEIRSLAPSEQVRLLSGSAAPAAVVLGLAELPPEASVEASPALLDAIYWLVDGLAARRPLLLAVDDLQWADAPSARAVAYLAHRADGLALVVLSTLRTGEIGPDPEATHTLQRASRRRLSPAPLSPAGACALATSTGVEVDAGQLHAVTGGNPFFVLELAEALRGALGLGGSTTVSLPAWRGVALARLSATSADAHGVARAVAVLGDGAHIADVAAWTQLSVEQVLVAAGELARARVFEDAVALGYAHPLLAEAVRLDATEHDRGLDHLRAARVLRARGNADPERVAMHLERSAPVADADAARELRAAAAQALQRGAPEAAIKHLERALAEPPPAEERAAVALELGMAEFAARRHADAVPRLAAALESPRWPAASAAAGAWATMATGGFPDVIAALRQGAAVRSGDDALWLAGQADWASSFLPVAFRAPVELPPATALDGATRGTRMALAAHVTRGLHAGGAATSAELTPLALRALRNGALARDGSAQGLALASAPLLALLYAEAVDAAQAEIALAERIARERTSAEGIASAMLPRTYLDLMRGSAAGTVAASASALELLAIFPGEGRHAAAAFVAAIHLLAVLAAEGPDAAGAALETLGVAGELSPVQIWILPVRAHVRLAQERSEEALADATMWHGASTAMGDQLMLVEFAVAYPLALAATGAPALDAAHAVLARERAWGAAGRISAALRMLAAVDPRGAGDALEEALGLAERSPLPLERARVRLARGLRLRRAGQRTEARTELEQALELAAGCKAKALLEQARSELHVLGARPRRHAFAGIDSLTRSERRVVDLAATGLTNRQIGQELWVTVKTVDSHLSRAFRKLGVARRTELTAILESQGDVPDAPGGPRREAPGRAGDARSRDRGS